MCSWLHLGFGGIPTLAQSRSVLGDSLRTAAPQTRLWVTIFLLLAWCWGRTLTWCQDGFFVSKIVSVRKEWQFCWISQTSSVKWHFHLVITLITATTTASQVKSNVPGQLKHATHRTWGDLFPLSVSGIPGFHSDLRNCLKFVTRLYFFLNK